MAEDFLHDRSYSYVQAKQITFNNRLQLGNIVKICHSNLKFSTLTTT